MWAEWRERAVTLLLGPRETLAYDRLLLWVSLSLLVFGLVMVTSASVSVSERMHNDPFHFAVRHGVYLVLALFALFATLRIPVERWQQANFLLLSLAVVLLVVVLVVGREVNGAKRWIAIGPITVQVGEMAKLFFFCFLAGYLVRRHDQVRNNLKGFLKPLAVFFVMAVLLLAEPDLGTVVVMFVTTVGMLFLAGARLWQFIALICTGLGAIALLVIAEPYRMRRMTSFLNPWEDPFGSGYQLTQSLMAFGRGGWSGAGLGNSIQKLEYLPEAHTDFVMAVVAEELGFLGVLVVVLLLALLVMQALRIGHRALADKANFDGYLAYGIAIWLAFQGGVNIGVASGLLPTKGLTMPLVSYGGSSLIVMAATMGLLMRIDHEQRMRHLQAMPRGGGR